MTIFALRMKNGNCVVAAAENETGARERAKDIGRDIEIASVRELSSFVARFTLTDEGELVSILLDRQTLSDLHSQRISHAVCCAFPFIRRFWAVSD